MPVKTTDEELMERYRNGSMDAFEELYGRHKARGYGQLSKRISSRFDRDEIQQNIFLKLHHSRHRYNSSFPFLPWLFTICRNVMIDFLRSKEAKEGRLTHDDGIICTLASEGEGPSKTDILGPAMARLNENQRESVRMRYGEESSFEEIAVRLDTSVPNARKLVSRAVKKLRELLNHKGDL